MILYRLKEYAILYPLSAKWTGVRTSDLYDEVFRMYDVMIDNHIYTANTELFQEHLEKEKMWEQLSHDMV